MPEKKEKIHMASPAIDSAAAGTGDVEHDEWDETQELLDDPVFMKSHEQAEKDRANGVSKKFSDIRRKV